MLESQLVIPPTTHGKRIFQMTERLYKWRLSRLRAKYTRDYKFRNQSRNKYFYKEIELNQNLCQVCEKDLGYGPDIWAYSTRSRHNTLWYHVECAIRKNMLHLTTQSELS